MKFNNKTKAILLVVTIICFACTPSFAQGPGFDDDVDDVPVDGGVSLLVAAGVGYGVKKWKDARKKKSDSNL